MSPRYSAERLPESGYTSGTLNYARARIALGYHEGRAGLEVRELMELRRRGQPCGDLCPHEWTPDGRIRCCRCGSPKGAHKSQS